LNQVLEYEITDIIKNITNNISQHYVKHINRYINAYWNVKDKIAQINDKNITPEQKASERSNLYSIYRKIKNDILNVENDVLTSDKQFHKWINEHKYKLIPKKDTYEENSIHYDVCVNPFDYLKHMIYINVELENNISQHFVDNVNLFINSY